MLVKGAPGNKSYTGCEAITSRPVYTQSNMNLRRIQILLLIVIFTFYHQCAKLYRSVSKEDGYLYKWENTAILRTVIPISYSNVTNYATEVNETCPYSPPLLCKYFTWCRHQMEAFSALLAFCEGNPSVTGEFPSQRPVTRSFDVLFHQRLYGFSPVFVAVFVLIPRFGQAAI